MQLPVTIEIWQKGQYFLAKCPELDFISQGSNREDAKKKHFGSHRNPIRRDGSNGDTSQTSKRII